MIRVLVVDDQALVRSGFRIILESEPDLEVVGEASDGAEAVALAAQLRPDVICMDVEMPVMDGIAAARAILSPASGGDAGVAGEGSVGGDSDSDSGDVSGDGGGPHRGPAILILTTFGHDHYLFDALAAGVSGFLLKTSRAEQLIEAVRSLAAGHALLGPDVTRAVLERVASKPARDPDIRIDAPPFVGASTPQPHTPSGPEATGSPPLLTTAMENAGLTEREREVLGLVARGRSNSEIAAALFLGEATVKTHVSNLLQKLGVRDRIQAVVWAHTRGDGA